MPWGIGHRRVARRGPTVPSLEPSLVRGCGHTRGNHATSDGVTLAGVRGHRFKDVLRPCLGEGRNMLRRGCGLVHWLSPFMVGSALRR